MKYPDVESSILEFKATIPNNELSLRSHIKFADMMPVYSAQMTDLDDKKNSRFL